ncbi:hypothetical protein FQN50_004505 [Emmonsiellopsis sp. PD_5]|nr:hypothetical protein FQN50_004505 [Emmonsiellopsis sp. PD_5]
MSPEELMKATKKRVMVLDDDHGEPFDTNEDIEYSQKSPVCEQPWTGGLTAIHEVETMNERKPPLRVERVLALGQFTIGDPCIRGTNGYSTMADGDDKDGLGPDYASNPRLDLKTVDNRISQLKAEDLEPLWENGSSAGCLMTTDGDNAVRGLKGEWRVQGGLESKVFANLESFADGMKICLRQMAESGSHVTLFRNVHGGRARFNGRLVIDFERKLIKWGYPKGGQFQVCQAAYTGQGTAMGKEHFRMRFLGFAYHSSRREQFEKIRSVITFIMRTFTEVHGYPEVTQYRE